MMPNQVINIGRAIVLKGVACWRAMDDTAKALVEILHFLTLRLLHTCPVSRGFSKD